MGLVSVLWKEFNDFKNQPDETVTVTLDQFHTTEKKMLLLGLASNSISYQRRKNILSYLIKDSRKAKSLLWEKKAALLQQYSQLQCFGKYSS